MAKFVLSASKGVAILCDPMGRNPSLSANRQEIFRLPMAKMSVRWDRLRIAQNVFEKLLIV